MNISNLTLANGRTETGDAGSALRNDEGASTTMTNVVVRDNQSSTFGGGISNWGNLTLRRSEVRNNSLPEGGGGQTSQGGGIFNVGRLVIEQSTVAQNLATRGGGISNTNKGSIDIRNSTISGNRAFGGGGGIRNVSDGRINIASSTITANRANEPGGFGEGNRTGGGIQNLSPARISIGGTILAGNIDNRHHFQEDFAPDCYSPTTFSFTSERSNLVGIVNSRCALRDVIWGTDASFDLKGTDTSPLDARIDPLGWNGGPTRTHPLRTNSPAVDGKKYGTSSTFFNCQTVDQRSSTRPLDGNGDGNAVCDIGAYERQAMPRFTLETAPTHDFPNLPNGFSAQIREDLLNRN